MSVGTAHGCCLELRFNLMLSLPRGLLDVVPSHISPIYKNGKEALQSLISPFESRQRNLNFIHGFMAQFCILPSLLPPFPSFDSRQRFESFYCTSIRPPQPAQLGVAYFLSPSIGCSSDIVNSEREPQVGLVRSVKVFVPSMVFPICLAECFFSAITMACVAQYALASDSTQHNRST